MPSSSGSSDFVRKLFNMLEEPEYRHILRWSDTGDSFIVLDTNEFTKTILPRHFKHSNFASFVRQLNKYDFHKVRNEDGAPSIYGEGAWEFRHDDFQLHHKDLLDNIKRKAPSKRNLAGDAATPAIENFRQRVDGIHDFQKSLDTNLAGLTNSYQTILLKMFELKRGIESRDFLIGSLISYLCDLENTNQRQTSSNSMFVPSHSLQKLIDGFQSITKGQNITPVPSMPHIPTSQPVQTPSSASKVAMDSTLAGQGTHRSMYATPSSDYDLAGQEKQANEMTSATSINTPMPTNGPPSLPHHSAFPVYEKYPPIPQPAEPTFSPHLEQNSALSKSYSQLSAESLAKSNPVADSYSFMASNMSMNGSIWQRQPRILLVEDDEVSRRMTINFLTLFDCQIEVAVDGINAVNKANSGGYDLILMDFILPQLDGLSVTCLIRQYDQNTPIVAITSNISMDDAVNYFNHGVTDLLVKPFTKSSLLQILKKQLVNMLQHNSTVSLSSGSPGDDLKDNKQPVSFYLETDTPMFPARVLQDPVQSDIHPPQ
ncbi:stress-responsive DNA-binding transcription factor Prr1 [Schizosaccharomyces osmophilus]|uniref:Transcription factor n=1 Tax=Schizosaccharomyces osmophilus TaxID=2545709 RepID=A0AAE9WC64_9SCHI|nr:stress-responsive DNA-binding transcription factor Prr1 [Schizosaccharomyces osmophilus]WBW73530.1 stress-responsive DNA-binding transcription factor Prr1 [Schizosaccharomyces osmophilus]